MTIETGEMADGWLSVRKDDKLTYFQRVPLDQEREEPLDELYYTTLYTDREIYQSTDEIRFWGNIAPRREGLEQPKQLEIALNDVYVQQVEVDEEGYFTGFLSFTALKQGAYSFAVRRGQDKKLPHGISVDWRLQQAGVYHRCAAGQGLFHRRRGDFLYDTGKLL